MTQLPVRVQRRLTLAGLLAILLAGILLRLPANLFLAGEPLHWLGMVHPQPGFQDIGFDETLYRGYVNSAIAGGVKSYPQIVQGYIDLQRTLTGSVLPPTRVLYILSATAWHSVFGTEALLALHAVSSFFSIAGFLIGVGFAWRLKGMAGALGVGALLAFAPTHIHMSQHALIDGVFAFWALLNLWLLWENLRAAKNWRWLWLYLVSLALMVTTKENAAFAYFGLLVLIGANRWLHWGTITRELLFCTVTGPLIGAVVLAVFCGGVSPLITAYQLSVSHSYQLAYAITTGDGPWHRYLVDLLLVSPVIMLLAIAAAFRLRREDKAELFIVVFIAASYLVMCNVKHGMNLRYASLWDMPLRLLSFSQLSALIQPITQRRKWILAALVALICAIEMHHYLVLFVRAPLHDLATEGLLRALQILKAPALP